MAQKKMTADEILDELKRDQKVTVDEKGAPSVDMGRIDDLIRDILTKNKEQELKKTSDQFTAQEKEEIEKEVRVQTNSLTRKLQKMQKEAGKARTTAIRVQLSGEIPETEQTSEALAEEAPEDDEPTLGMTPEAFLELREKRQHRAEQFVLDPARPPQEAKPEGLENSEPADEGKAASLRSEQKDALPQSEIDTISAADLMAAAEQIPSSEVSGEPKIEQDEKRNGESVTAEKAPFSIKADLDDGPTGYIFSSDDEYVSVRQRDSVLAMLKKQLRRARISRALTAICALCGVLLAAVQFGVSSVWVLGLIEVSPLVYTALCAGLIVVSLLASFPLFSSAAHGVKKDVFCLVSALIVLSANVIFLFSPETLLNGRGVLYAPLTALSLFALACARVMRQRRILYSFELLSSEEEKNGVLVLADGAVSREMTRGLAIEEEPVLAVNTPAAFFDGFLTREQQSDPADHTARLLLWVSVGLGFAFSVALYLLTSDLYASVTLFSGAAALGFGLLYPVMCELTLYDSRPIFENYESTIPDWTTIEDAADVNCILMNATELFPEGSVVLHGIKTFQGTRIDTAIVDAASVICKADSVLRDVFLYIINGRTELLKPVDTVRYEDLMGLSAWVDEKRVLIGNRDLMINHSVAVPKRGYEEPYQKDGCEVVYLAREGELYAAFIVEFTAAERPSAILDMMNRRGLCAAVRSVDACITPALLERVFGVSAEEIKILPARLHELFEERHKPRERAETSLANKGRGNSAFVVSVAACGQLLRCIKRGRILCLIGAVLLILVLGGLLYFDLMTAASAAAAACGALLLFLFYWLYERNMKL